MLSSPDFKELLKLFIDHEVRYLVVGGYAVMRYTEPRFTKDLDIWVPCEPKNARAVFNALRAFGAPLKDMTAEDFCTPGTFYQMGSPPLRVDVIMSLQGVDFEDCWAKRESFPISGFDVPFIAKADLIQAKRTAGRLQDLLDLEKLEKSGP